MNLILIFSTRTNFLTIVGIRRKDICPCTCLRARPKNFNPSVTDPSPPTFRTEHILVRPWNSLKIKRVYKKPKFKKQLKVIIQRKMPRRRTRYLRFQVIISIKSSLSHASLGLNQLKNISKCFNRRNKIKKTSKST